jgi:hypothetical protein
MPKAPTLDRREPKASGDLAPDELRRRLIHRRAFEAVIWGMPAVNYELMFREMADKLGGGSNQILYWSRLLDWRNQTLTPNPDVIYLMPFFNTKDVGPVVLEVPPADDGVFNGSIMNYWQAAIEDVGPGGVDKGKGGKYAVLPPGYDPKDLPAGYIPMPSDTYQGYALCRSVLSSGGDAGLTRAIAYSTRMKLYPLSQAANPPETVFVDATNVVFDSTIPYDIRFFRSLDRMVQAEPFLERDRLMIDPLKTIGIQRGELFDPDPETQALLEDAIGEAKAWFESRYGDLPRFYDDRRSWFFPVSEESHQAILNFWRAPDSFPMDERGLTYTFAFFSGKHLGQAQYYLMATTDSAGAPLDGKASYRLNVPADAPVTQYWSTTVYDRATHAFIRDMRRVGRSSQSPGLQLNPDGSVDLFYGPKAPAQGESNWIPTDPAGGFEVLARFYGPKPALFDKSWRLGDIEKVG